MADASQKRWAAVWRSASESVDGISEFAISIGGLAAFGVAAGMVGLRDVARPEVTALALAGVVVVAARLGGRSAGDPWPRAPGSH